MRAAAPVRYASSAPASRAARRAPRASFGSAKRPQSSRWLRPRLRAEESIWMTGAPSGKGASSTYHTSSKNSPPTRRTRSASPAAARTWAWSPRPCARTQGWREGTFTCTGRTSPCTSAPIRSASAISSSPAPLRATRSPAKTTGRSAASTRRAASATPSGSGAARRQIRDGGIGPWEVRSFITLNGRATKTGPVGGSCATLNARWRSSGSSPADSACALHLVTGAAIATRSCHSTGSRSRKRVSCWPAVTTSGVRPSQAL